MLSMYDMCAVWIKSCKVCMTLIRNQEKS